MDACAPRDGRRSHSNSHGLSVNDEEVVVEKVVLLDALESGGAHPPVQVAYLVDHLLVPGGPVAAEIDYGDTAAGSQVFFQAFQIFGLIGDVVQRVDDGDQVYGLWQLRVGFGGKDRFDVGQFLLLRRAFDVFEQFGIDVNGVNYAFAAGLPRQRARKE